MSIHLHIERVVLHGISVPERDVADLHAALQAELTRQLAAHGIAPALLKGAALPHLTAAPVQSASTATAHRLGSDIARAAFGAIGNADASLKGGTNHG